MKHTIYHVSLATMRGRRENISMQQDTLLSLRSISPNHLRKFVHLHRRLLEATPPEEDSICRDALKIVEQMQEQEDPIGSPVR